MISVPCSGCEAPLRAGARFCASCGAFVGRASAEIEITRGQPADREELGGGLFAAGAAYVAVLAVSASLVLRADISLESLRYAALAIVGFGILGTILYRRVNFPILKGPSLSIAGGAGLLAFAVAFGVAIWAGSKLLPDGFMLDDVAFHRAAGATIFLLLLDFALLPALGEELVFRGVILNGLRGSFRDETAVIISALLFATIHLSAISFLHLAVLGYVLARVRLKTGSIWPCIAIHGAYNATILVLGWTA